ncbi:MAG TPA: glycine oxidase ThiO [Polyangiaceae bacterium]|nr:glycine oxidase ThiO [Polyangiaceae bacterium]
MPRSPKTKTHARVRRADVVIVGGGVMGSACAWKLAEAGARVVVLEKSVPGAEASSAAAGILGAHAEAHGPGPMADLLLASLARYGAWAKALSVRTGIDIELRPSGVLRVALARAELVRAERDTAWMKRPAREVATLSAKQVQKFEPSLSKTAGALHFPTDARVDPKLLFRAVHIAAQRAGAVFESGAYVKTVLVDGKTARGVLVEDGTEYSAPTVIVAAGSWSTLVAGTPIGADAVVPARGQVVELSTPAPPLSHVVMGPRCYLVPRDDGRVLVGATLEFVGYRREVTAGAVRALLDAAIELVPSLEHAVLRDAWSSFRPFTPDELPLLGRTRVNGLLLATGHYRNGILLAPITAEIVAAIAAGKRPPVDVGPFEASRLLLH